MRSQAEAVACRHREGDVPHDGVLVDRQRKQPAARGGARAAPEPCRVPLPLQRQWPLCRGLQNRLARGIALGPGGAVLDGREVGSRGGRGEVRGLVAVELLGERGAVLPQLLPPRLEEADDAELLWVAIAASGSELLRNCCNFAPQRRYP